MAQVTFKGDAVNISGTLPVGGDNAPDVTLTDVNLQDKKLSDFKGKKVVLNIFPSINTGVCATSVRKFNEKASSLDDAVVVCVSKDLPFAQANFCAAEGLKNVVMLSDFRSDFGKQYGVEITDGAMKGLLSRAVVVVDKEGKVAYTEQVTEISNEPDYAAALEYLQ